MFQTWHTCTYSCFLSGKRNPLQDRNSYILQWQLHLGAVTACFESHYQMWELPCVCSSNQIINLNNSNATLKFLFSQDNNLPLPGFEPLTFDMTSWCATNWATCVWSNCLLFHAQVIFEDGILFTFLSFVTKNIEKKNIILVFLRLDNCRYPVDRLTG